MSRPGHGLQLELLSGADALPRQSSAADWQQPRLAVSLTVGDGLKELVIRRNGVGGPARGCHHEFDPKRKTQRARPLRVPARCAHSTANA